MHKKPDVLKKKQLICTSIDDKYLWPWLVMVYSAVINSREKDFRFVLGNINGLLSQPCIEVARKFMDNLQIEFEVVNIKTSLSPVFTHQFNLTVYSRLFLMDLLEDDFLWLDADLLLLPGWDLIFEEFGDLINEDIILYGVQDATNTQTKLSQIQNQAFKKNNGRYVNSGVLRVSNKSWKQVSSQNDWQEIAQNSESYELTFPDQDVLNLLCSGKISLIPQSFNYIVGDEVSIHSQIFVQHYAGSPKPWQLDKKSKEFLMGIQGTRYFSPKDWITQSRDAFTYFPDYWKTESALLTFLHTVDEKLALEVDSAREKVVKPLDKRSRIKLSIMKIATKKFSK